MALASIATNGKDDGFGNLAIALGTKRVKLKSGTYWVSVQANMNHKKGEGDWNWSTRRKQNGADVAESEKRLCTGCNT